MSQFYVYKTETNANLSSIILVKQGHKNNEVYVEYTQTLHKARLLSLPHSPTHPFPRHTFQESPTIPWHTYKLELTHTGPTHIHTLTGSVQRRATVPVNLLTGHIVNYNTNKFYNYLRFVLVSDRYI